MRAPLLVRLFLLALLAPGLAVLAATPGWLGGPTPDAAQES